MRVGPVPSSKPSSSTSQLIDLIRFSGSLGVAVNVICWRVWGFLGRWSTVAAGGRLGIVTVPVATSGAPLASTTLTLNGYAPGIVNCFWTLSPEVSNVPSSLRSHVVASGRPSGSVDVEPNVTGPSVVGAAGEIVNAALGGWLVAVTVFVAMSVAPLESVT